MAKKKKTSNNPFMGYTVEEVFAAESKNFVVEVLGDLYSEDAGYSFLRGDAEQVYEKVTSNLRKLIKSGTDKQRKEALVALPWVFIKPLRIH